MALVKQDDGEEHIIKPEAVTPAIDTSAWPLLLRNWDQCKLSSATQNLPCNADIESSTRPNRSFHPNPRRMHTSPPRSEILHLFRSHQSRQTL